ncbi:MAG TPA: MFS transporter [Bacteroidia bacterium]|nr:MFS transporter [Bacteroidia bacterium]
MKAAGRILNRSILLLGFVSLFTDISSEMLYPVLPVYLKSIGYTALWIGILEGLAEATAGLSKGYFGKLSDDKGRRMPFVQLGYLMSALSKPLLVLFVQPFWVLACRVTDRLGKGIRTGARDAVLSDECLPENRGKVYGFHRAMDTTGAVIGPLMAIIWLWHHPGQYAVLFLAALLPGLAGVACTFLVREKKLDISPAKERKPFFSFLTYWKQSGDGYKKLAGALVFFALFNSSDVFLLLIAKQHGLSDTHVILAYVFYNLIYALFSMPMGMLADKAGMKVSLCLGLFFFVIAYAGMALTRDTTLIYIFFFIYGLYAAATDGVSKAWVSKLVPKSETATAIGFLAGATSVAAVVASTLTGLAWQMAGSSVALMASAIAAGITCVYFLLRVREQG